MEEQYPVTIQVGKSLATIVDMYWKSDDLLLQRQLQATVREPPRSPGDPWPEWTYAQTALKEIGGKIVGYKKPPKPVPGRIY